MIFFVVLAIYSIEKGDRTWLAGLAFGMALNIKVVPLIFLPAIFLYLQGKRRRIEFLSAAAVLLTISSIPYIFQDPRIIIKSTLGYSSIYGRWGWTRLLKLLLPDKKLIFSSPYEVIGFHRPFMIWGRYITMAVIVGASYIMNRRATKVPLFLQCGVVVCMFLVLTPGFGIQYLSWLVPFVVLLGAVPALIFYWSGAAYIFLVYGCWYDLFLTTALCARLQYVTYFLELLCWCCVIYLLILYQRVVRRYWVECRLGPVGAPVLSSPL
jgi:uncharacterized membrane protein